MTLTTHHLQISGTVATPLALDAQRGAAIRGALANGLWDRFCTNKAAPACAACPLVQVCPVAALVAPLRADDHPGSANGPRPYTIQPPTGDAATLTVGEPLAFGLSLIGRAAQLFPYVVLAAQALEDEGLGQKLAVNGWRRGRLRLSSIEAVHPLSGARQPLFAATSPRVQAPGLPVLPAEVAVFAATLPSDRLTLHLRTPMRVIEQDRLLKRFALRPVIQRLLRRLDDLSRAYGDGPLAADYPRLLAIAEGVRVEDDRTRWVDVVSYSARQDRRTPIGGLVGSVTVAGDLGPLRELLVWGSLVHVGKNAVKGDGCYTVVA